MATEDDAIDVLLVMRDRRKIQQVCAALHAASRPVNIHLLAHAGGVSARADSFDLIVEAAVLEVPIVQAVAAMRHPSCASVPLLLIAPIATTARVDE
jgi:hypothetical protein